ncbi:MAG: hypothetical protein COA49_03185 [Bacteroidetes bacterium]|nr:MAG: hypothetical protein COA49_03185 [Bacteroidota bacterium]
MPSYLCLRVSKSNNMRFRRLTEEEFTAVESEFVKFLSSQGVDAPEWQKIKRENPHMVEYLLDEFSTFFWESTTSRITFLERHSEEDRWVFKFSETKAKVLRLVHKKSEKSPDIFRGEKEFPPEARGREIFLLLEQGLLPCPEDKHSELEKLFTE